MSLKIKHFLYSSTIVVLILTFTQSCGVYSFTGGSTGDAKTIQIDYFPNNALLVEPRLSNEFTLALQDLFLRQTNLNLVKNNGDLQFEGEITTYRIEPMMATAQQTAAQNRLTIGVSCRFFNKLKEEDNFEQKFSFYYDYDANAQLTGSVIDDGFKVIFERITQDIFNASIAKW
ncbi:MAG: LptE family protein [Flavobacteriales bacterium]|nr:LptE family protein [Flavobacteriales bacterium]